MSATWTEPSQSSWPPQIAELTEAIDAAPHAPGNYVLRGEAWLSSGEIARARIDFETALAQTEAILQQSEWGYLVQAYYDRAVAGLWHCGGTID